MSKLIEIINSNPMLKRLQNMVEYGMSTADLKLLLQHLCAFEVEGTAVTADQLSQFRKQVADDMSAKDCSNRDVLEMSNVLAIYSMATVAVQPEATPTDDIDISWAGKFYDCARTIKDTELQSLWSKIFAKELMKPNSFFKRTLDVFAKADKFEIDWFYEVTKYVYDQACVPEFILFDNKFYPFNQFQTLIDAGFVNSNSGSISYHSASTLHFANAEVNIDVPKPPFGFSIYTLTDAGAQLIDLQSDAATDDFLTKLKEVLERNGLAKVTSIDRK